MFEKLFEDIGKKIKGIALTIFVIELLVSIIGGFAFIFNSEDDVFGRVLLLGLLIMAGGFIASWLSVVLLYGFGELIDRVSIVSDQLDVTNEHLEITYEQLEEVICSNSMTLKTQLQQTIEDKPQRQSEPHNADSNTLVVRLRYALGFHSDASMINFLETIEDNRIKRILIGPQDAIREEIENLLNDIS